MSYVDLLTPAHDAVITALQAAPGMPGMPAGLAVYSSVPENTQPPYIMLGQISGVNQSDVPGEQLEEITFEVVVAHRGNERRTQLAVMHAVRTLLHNQQISAPGAHLSAPDYLKFEAGDAIADGVTWISLQTFRLTAEPA